MVVLASPLTAPNPSAKPRWARTEDQTWDVNNVHGPGCEERTGLRGGFSTIISRPVADERPSSWDQLHAHRQLRSPTVLYLGRGDAGSQTERQPHPCRAVADWRQVNADQGGRCVLRAWRAYSRAARHHQRKPGYPAYLRRFRSERTGGASPWPARRRRAAGSGSAAAPADVKEPRKSTLSAPTWRGLSVCRVPTHRDALRWGQATKCEVGSAWSSIKLRSASARLAHQHLK